MNTSISIDRWLIQGSTFAADIDFLIALVGVMVGFWWLVTNVMFVYLLWEYREKKGVKALYVTGYEHNLHKYVAWPHYAIIVCDVFLIYFAVKVWYDIKQDLPEGDAQIRIVAQQWAWSFQHEGADGELGTEDDIFTVDEMHIETGKLYHFHLESRDVLHSFSIPIFRLKQDIIPGRVIVGWFEPTVTGTYDLQCAEMCGIGHGIMGARVTIHSSDDYQTWIASHGGSVASR